MQNCSVTQLRDKEVISTKSGCRIGYVFDVEINLKEGRLCALLLEGRRPHGSLLGRRTPIRIPWSDIEVIGDDTILVRFTPPPEPEGPKGGPFAF